MTSHLRSAGDHGRPVDLVMLYQRLAKQLEAEGLEHPHVAAAVIAVRGAAAMKPDEFATAHDIVHSDLRAAEAGELAWTELPRSITAVLAATPGFNLDAVPGADRSEARPSDGPVDNAS